MSARQETFVEKPEFFFRRMEIRHVKDVVEIEKDVFPFPWSYDSFINCVACGYDCWVMRDESDDMLGYFVAIKVVDETHLLTFAIRSASQRHGLGRIMLKQVIEVAREIGTDSVFLEVRPSNEPARNLYESMGFKEIGRRKNYYIAAANTREDAIMMRLPL